VAVLREMARKAPAPRNAFVPFRLGQVFGGPGDAARQRAVLWAALGVLQSAGPPGVIVDLPFRWKRGTWADPLAR
jgi:D-proline reductase (dithiol) PrdB